MGEGGGIQPPKDPTAWPVEIAAICEKRYDSRYSPFVLAASFGQGWRPG
jgi:hypothetical protein